MVSLTSRRYRAFGLALASEIRLDPYLERADEAGEACDVELTLGIASSERGPRDVELVWPEAGRFLIRDGRRVHVAPNRLVSEPLLAEFVAGPVLAVLLEQRGAFVLHASAVAIDDRVAIAFSGLSGAGKSTTAALFAASGFALVADDIVPLRLDHDGVSCRAGPTLAKLDWARVSGWGGLTSVGREADARKSLVAWARTVPAGATRALRAIYALEDGPEVEVRRLTGQAVLATLLRDAFCLEVASPRRKAARLGVCAEIGRRVAVSALRRPRDLAQAQMIVGAVKASLA